MNTIEDLLQQNTKALIENTAALREILSLGAPKKRAANVKETPAPVVEEPVVEEPVVEETPSTSEDFPSPDLEEPAADIPVAELREKMKPLIQAKLLASTDGTVKEAFHALRQKFGVSVIKELTDEQVPAFYAEVEKWG